MSDVVAVDAVKTVAVAADPYAAVGIFFQTDYRTVEHSRNPFYGLAAGPQDQQAVAIGAYPQIVSAVSEQRCYIKASAEAEVFKLKQVVVII